MKGYMTQKQLAELLGIGQTTLSYWHKHKMIPSPIRINNRPKYTLEDAYEIARIRGIKLPSK